MKINECAVIDIELLKSQVSVLRKNCEIFKEFNDLHAVSSRMRVINTIESIIELSIPLESIVRDAYNSGVDNTSYDSFEDCYDVTVTAEDYIDQTDI